MPTAKHYAPEGIRSITPHLPIKGAAKAIAFYQKAFGAEVRSQSPGPGGGIIHAELRIGDSSFYLADESPQSPAKAPTSVGASTVMLTLFVSDCDGIFKQAIAAGGKELMAPADMFWGDRYSQLTDPFGHVWSIATHKEDVSPEEMEKRSAAFFAQFAAQQK
jgi:PhnB protein